MKIFLDRILFVGFVYTTPKKIGSCDQDRPYSNKEQIKNDHPNKIRLQSK